ncbi:MAG: DUF1232 domain-containing protein [Chlorobi bacterium]|nr:MAG: hypothetical protein UZ07_CHB004002839 [Chlorobi bacterium OLB7]MBK8911989.1 DUF1232 domain-containing protein [Chlorobiota bacterium]MBX7215373.1 DUF1232 domain-containing protein [Candidatus Kapabacteria bacterium]
MNSPQRVHRSLFWRLRKLPAYFGDRSVPFWKKVGVAVGLLYVISPFDAVSDFLPVIGWLDDLGVLGVMYLFLTRELEGYARRGKD